MTERKLSDYLPFYLGCEVEYEGVLNGKELREELKANKHDMFYVPKIQEIKGKKRGFLREIKCNQSGRYTVCKVGRRGLKSFWGVPDFKLVLRPLSDMTYDEFTEAGKIHVEAGGTIRIAISDVKTRETLPTYPEVFRWALAKGFDLFNLIPDGLAINKSTIQK